jgi:hypothetical protein
MPNPQPLVLYLGNQVETAQNVREKIYHWVLGLEEVCTQIKKVMTNAKERQIPRNQKSGKEGHVEP